MSYRWIEHTAEVEIEIEAASEEGVFIDALRALAELVADDRHAEHVARELKVNARERAVLLLEWLDELVYLAETEGLAPEDVERIELSDGGLVAMVRCRRDDQRHVVKGATYHHVAFERSGAGFRATVVLDV
jgi:protein archease